MAELVGKISTAMDNQLIYCAAVGQRQSLLDALAARLNPSSTANDSNQDTTNNQENEQAASNPTGSTNDSANNTGRGGESQTNVTA